MDNYNTMGVRNVLAESKIVNALDLAVPSIAFTETPVAHLFRSSSMPLGTHSMMFDRYMTGVWLKCAANIELPIPGRPTKPVRGVRTKRTIRYTTICGNNEDDMMRIEETSVGNVAGEEKGVTMAKRKALWKRTKTATAKGFRRVRNRFTSARRKLRAIIFMFQVVYMYNEYYFNSNI